MATCQVCATELHGRSDAKFCSVTCRVHAHRRSDGPPAELTTRDRWVCHKQKVPCVPFGAFASSTNPETWRDHATAVSAAAAQNIDGIGFVLNGDGIACIDLDDCLHDGVLADWAREIVDQCPRTYIEVSPSGRGLHIFGYATVGKGRRGSRVEVYDRGRYICITGRRFEGFPKRLAPIQGLIDAI